MVRDYVKFLPKDPDFNAFLTEFQDESDRAAAVLAAVYLEDLLSILLSVSSIDDQAAVVEVFQGDRPLSNHGKINLGYVLGLISEQERNDLRRINTIRNKFAHKRGGVSFESAPVVDLCRAFECLAERFRAEPELRRVYPDEPRLLFDLATAVLAYYLIRRSTNATRAERPQPVLWPKYDLPEERR